MVLPPTVIADELGSTGSHADFLNKSMIGLIGFIRLLFDAKVCN